MIQTVCLLKEIHPSEPITFWSFMEIMLDHQERSLAVDQLWSLNNGTRCDRIRPSERTFLLKETGRKSNMNLFAIREETKIFGLSF